MLTSFSICFEFAGRVIAVKRPSIILNTSPHICITLKAFQWLIGHNSSHSHSAFNLKYLEEMLSFRRRQKGSDWNELGNESSSYVERRKSEQQSGEYSMTLLLYWWTAVRMSILVHLPCKTCCNSHLKFIWFQIIRYAVFICIIMWTPTAMPLKFTSSSVLTTCGSLPFLFLSHACY